jgi:hypothetical protein
LKINHNLKKIKNKNKKLKKQGMKWKSSQIAEVLHRRHEF